MATLWLRDIGRVSKVAAPSDRSESKTSSPHFFTAAEILPEVFLLATVNRIKNQCLLEISQASLTSPHQQSCQSSSTTPSTSYVLPVYKALYAAFRIPRVIQVLEEDEGYITTIELLVDRQHHNAVAGQPFPFHVHLFIGTSNGTVLLCNALSATILAIAQFQYHHDFSHSRVSGSSADAEASWRRGAESQFSGEAESPTKINEAVTRFAVQSSPKTAALHWNPSLPVHVRLVGDGEAANASSASSEGATVYVVHSGGKVVRLGRNVLDVLIKTSADHLDGKRPLFVIEWPPSSSSTSNGVSAPFPVVGPASHFASMVEFVFTLPPPGQYSELERRATISEDRNKNVAPRGIRDAAVLYSPVNPRQVSLLLQQGPRATESILVCGSNPAYAFYALESTCANQFSATSAVRAVTSLVKGMARNLWFSARGSGGGRDGGDGVKTLENAQGSSHHLPKKPQKSTTAFLERDSAFSRVLVDPSNQWAALYAEAAGRLYVCELSTGTVCHVIKGCRAAQFQWWQTNLGGRRATLLVVYEPLRRAVHVYALRLAQRVAACHVPEGCTLLRMADTAVASSAATQSFRETKGGTVVLLGPTGTLLRVEVDDGQLAEQMQAYARRQKLQQAGLSAEEALPREVLRSCRTPDDYAKVACQLSMPTCSVTPAPPMLVADATEVHVSLSVRLPTGKQLKQVRLYQRQLTCLADSLRQCFGCDGQMGSAFVATTQALSLAATAQEATPHSQYVTPQQCLYLLQAKARAVEGYLQLLTCKALTLAELTRMWTTPQTSRLWQMPVMCVGSGGATRHYWGTAVAAAMKRLGPHSSEAGTIKRLLAEWEGMKYVHNACYERGCADIPTFLSWFTCTGKSLCLGISSTIDGEGADSHAVRCFVDSVVYGEDVYAQLADLAFGGGRGLSAFTQQMQAAATLGLHSVDMAAITLTWVARVGLSTDAAVVSGSLGVLCLVLQAITDEAFLAGLERVLLPLFIPCASDRSSELAAQQLRTAAMSLILCSAARHSEKPIATKHAPRLLLCERRLLQLWRLCPSAEKEIAVITTAMTATYQSTSGGIVGVRLGCLLPISVVASASIGGTADDAAGTTLGEFLTTHGAGPQLTRSLVSRLLGLDLSVPPRGEEANTAGAAESMMALGKVLSSTNAVKHSEGVFGESRSGVAVAPWIKAEAWDRGLFEAEVLVPLASQFTAFSASNAGPVKPDAGRQWQLFNNSCAIVSSLGALQALIVPLCDVSFPFWEQNKAPDGGFLPLSLLTESTDVPEIASSVSEFSFSGSRTTRNFLYSVLALAERCAVMLEGTPGASTSSDDRARTLLTQAIATCLVADDAAAFACVPNSIRGLLKRLLQSLARCSATSLHRVREVASLAGLLIFCMESPACRIDGELLGPISALVISWTRLYGATSRTMQLLPPDSFTAPCATTPLRTPIVYDYGEGDVWRRGQKMYAAATVVRQFLSKCVLASSVVLEENACVVDDSVFARLTSSETTAVLERLLHVLGLDTCPLSAAAVVLDYAVKHLCRTEQLRGVLTAGVPRELVAAIALVNLRVLLNLAMEYMSSRKRKAEARGDERKVEQWTQRLDGTNALLSAEGHHWLREFAPTYIPRLAEEDTEYVTQEERAMQSSHKGTMSAGVSDVGHVSAVDLVMNGCWMLREEYATMQKLMQVKLRLPTGDPMRRDFCELFFVLAQLACEGSAAMPVAMRRVVAELPALADALKCFL